MNIKKVKSHQRIHFGEFHRFKERTEHKRRNIICLSMGSTNRTVCHCSLYCVSSENMKRNKSKFVSKFQAKDEHILPLREVWAQRTHTLRNATQHIIIRHVIRFIIYVSLHFYHRFDFSIFHIHPYSFVLHTPDTMEHILHHDRNKSGHFFNITIVSHSRAFGVERFTDTLYSALTFICTPTQAHGICVCMWVSENNGIAAASIRRLRFRHTAQPNPIWFNLRKIEP